MPRNASGRKRVSNRKTRVQPAKPAVPKSKPKSSRRSLIPTLILVLVLVGLGFQALYLGKKHAAQDISLLTVGPVIGKHPLPYVSLACDKHGNFYQLNGHGDEWMITKYSPDNQELLFFQATSTDDFLINAVSLAADANDNIYVLQKDGVIKIFNNDLKYQRMFNPGLTEASSLDIDSKGRLFVASRLHNKIVVVSPDGTVEAELGSPDSKSGPLAYPVRVVVSKNDDLVVCENLPTGIRIKVFSPQLELKKKFMIDKLKYIAWTMMGIDPNNRIYFNDHAGFDGIVIYDSSNGKFFGKSLRTKSRQTFDHPGGLTVNKWTGAIYVAYIPGVVQCRLPNPS